MIRLSRVGKKKQPSYRVVVSEKSKDPWGDNTEVVGFYDPLSDPKTVRFEKDRVLHWLSVGAKASPTVHNLLVSAGIVDGTKERATKGDIQKRQMAAQKAAVAAHESTQSDEKSSEEAEAKADDEISAEAAVQDEGTPEAEKSEGKIVLDSEVAEKKKEVVEGKNDGESRDENKDS